MPHPSSTKQLLTHFNQSQYRAFTLNDSAKHLDLPQVSTTPWIAATSQLDYYEKEIITPSGNPEEKKPHITFIKKGGSPHAFLWHTQADTLKKAVRWGIIRAQSVTGKVIAALGQYRVVVHERVAKGMVSNSQAIKLKLLDLYQDRFEALQQLESMANKNNSLQQYRDAITNYIDKLKDISNNNFSAYFDDTLETGFNENTKKNIANDIQADIDRACAYRDGLNKNNLHAHNQPRGSASIITFVQEQMIQGLYEFQGINQDLSYSRQRYFALTRGELNDYIENAKKIINDHPIDPRNTVTNAHHGRYSNDPKAFISYDFSEDDLSADRQRDILLAISFIEQWDVLNNTKNELPTVGNLMGREGLDTIKATRWRQHRTVSAILKSYGFYLLNIIKGMFVPTHPWEESAWKKAPFHLFANELRQRVKLNEPLWKKPAHFFKRIIYSVRDLINGARDVGTEIAFRMPSNLLNDWESSKDYPTWDLIKKEAADAFEQIKTLEDARLNKVLPNKMQGLQNLTLVKQNQLAQVEYELTIGEENDFFTAVARGLNGAADILSHHIFAKDPLAGLFFTGAYAIGVGAIFYPSITASIMGENYVRVFSSYAYSIASSSVAATLSASITQAQIVAITWDGLMHGPSGIGMKTLHKIGEDPLTTVAFFATIYGLGSVLVNGINGYDIPWFSKHCKAELGTNANMAYPSIGLKAGIGMYELLRTEDHRTSQHPNLLNDESAIKDRRIQTLFQQNHLAHWLSEHALLLPKLPHHLLFNISRHIDHVFKNKKAEGDSLKKLLYPDRHLSIAFQLISIPLSYIPAVLRVGLSYLLCMMAFATGKPHPEEPIKRATINLLQKIKKDLTRLIVFNNYLWRLPYLMVSTLLKMPTYLATLIIGRLASLINVQPAHAIHRSFATIHIFFKKITEFFYPANLLKSVTVAHPNHTIIKIDTAYRTLLQQLLAEEITTATQDNPHSQASDNFPQVRHSGTSPASSTFHLFTQPDTIKNPCLGVASSPVDKAYSMT